ncbi:ComF family protein [Flavobacterium sp. 14A]|uniref:ComF family protein n=1 Tax=Flavobacterium sp. 14A TaxID=2735896 RepID=UPI00156EB5E5|nr:phosphoribosyltransferase family protein [Flavobacterium sp. 14A]NRT12237.1 ComF family protein [Flavobacterium sp. 14A]
MFKSLLNLFFPKTCSGCSSYLTANETIICTTCRHDIPLTNHYLNQENEAFKKFYGRVAVRHVSCFVYFHKKGIVQEMIHNLKYRGHEEVGSMLGNWYAADLKSVPEVTSATCIIPVPLHKRKLRERGYNQVATFGKALSTQLSLPYNDKVLIRKVYSKTQSKKNLLGRTEGIQSTFDVNFTSDDHNKHFLLIDDVITTGATLEACSKALLKIPGASISIVCMAMTES